MTMTLSEYQVLAARTLAGHGDIDIYVDRLVEEAAEVKKVMRKFKESGRGGPFPIADLREELGDVQWTLAAIAQCLHAPLEEIAKDNITKLEKRHPNGFNPEYKK